MLGDNKQSLRRCPPLNNNNSMNWVHHESEKKAFGALHDSGANVGIVAVLRRNATEQQVLETAQALQEKFGMSPGDAWESVFREPKDWRRGGYFSVNGSSRLALHRLGVADSIAVTRPGPEPTAREWLDHTLRELEEKHDTLKSFIVRNLKRISPECTCQRTQKQLDRILQMILDDELDRNS
jgi:hypothetical protein